MAIDAEIVNFNDLDLVDNPSDTSELLIKTSDGIVKRVTKAELFEDEAAARTARDAELQNQIYTLAGAGSTEGSFRVVEKLDASLKGAAGGLAELDSDGHVPSSQLPSYVDDSIEGYLNDSNGNFYLHYTPSTVTHDIWSDGTSFINSDLTEGTEPSGTAGTAVELGAIRSYNDGNDVYFYEKIEEDWFEVTGLTSSAITVSDTAESDADIIAALEEASDITISYIPYEETTGTYSDLVTPESGKVYVDIRTNITYRWSGSQYTKIGSDLSLGETSSTAYRGDRGKIAYDHSQTLGTGTVTNTNPHGLSKTDIGLGNVPNVATNDQTPTFTESSSNEELTSGETLSTLFGKLKKVVKSFITHIDTTVSTNPHLTTKADVGLGNVENYGRSTSVASGDTNYITGGAVYTELSNLDSAKQPKTMSSSVSVGGVTQTTVEGAISALANLPAEAVFHVSSLPTGSSIENVIYHNTTDEKYYVGNKTAQTTTELNTDSVKYVSSLPASPDIENVIYAIEALSGNYKFYAGDKDNQTTHKLGTDSTFTGTQAEWDALTNKSDYTIVNITDDIAEGGAVVVDEVTSGNFNAVTSNAVYNAMYNSRYKVTYYYNANTPRSNTQDYENGLLSALNYYNIPNIQNPYIFIIRYEGGYYALFEIMNTGWSGLAKIILADDANFENSRYGFIYSDGRWVSA